MKKCKKCGLEKPELEFRPKRNICKECGRENARTWNRKHVEHCRARSKQWRQENPEVNRERKRLWSKAHPESRQCWYNKNKDRAREILRKSFYGITQKGFEALYSSQAGKCAICSAPIADGSGCRGLVIDHCHASGKVRGLLCARCNLGLGHFNDDPMRMRLAADYIEKHR